MLTSDFIVSKYVCRSGKMRNRQESRLFQKPGNHHIFRKNALGVKRPFSELWESSGVFSEQLLESRNWFSEWKIPFSEWHLTTCATQKTTILGATLGATSRSDGNPHEAFSFAPAFSEHFCKNWGGPRAPDYFIRRNPKGDGRKGTGQKMS